MTLVDGTLFIYETDKAQTVYCCPLKASSRLCNQLNQIRCFSFASVLIVECVIVYRLSVHLEINTFKILTILFHIYQLFLCWSFHEHEHHWLHAGKSTKCFGMELFSRRRWRLDRPKQKAVVFMLNSKKLCKTCMA